MTGRRPTPIVLALAGLVLWPQIAGAASQKYGGFECPIDCKGHREGFRWAHDKGVNDRLACTVGSAEFIEGCYAFVDNPLRNPDLDDAGAPIDW